MIRKKNKAFTLIELMIAVAIIGILAGVAVPAFLKYMKKAKTTEALVNIRKIYDGEVAYYQDDHVSESGFTLPAQFVEAPPTPATLPQNWKLAGNWEDPAWIAIKFAVDAPVLFRYSVIATGTGIGSVFDAQAEGDLDGDGITSYFKRSVRFDSNTGQIDGGGGVYKQNEIE